MNDDSTFGWAMKPPSKIKSRVFPEQQIREQLDECVYLTGGMYCETSEKDIAHYKNEFVDFLRVLWEQK